MSDAQQQKRVEQAQRFSRKLMSHQRRAWHGIVTLDESWFSLTMHYEFIWLPEIEKVPEMKRSMTQSQKFVLTIIWTPQRFH
jgi:hypothetical protein